MADKLTPQQRLAVENRGGRLLVSAAAGSGKTKVLVERLLRYLTDPVAPADIDQFLIITFTKAAASELRGKIAAALSERVAQEPDNRHLQRQLQRLYMTQISTVHSFCGDLLRQFAYRLDLQGDFRVAEENETAQLRLEVMDRVLTHAYETAQNDTDFRAFVDSQGLGRKDDQLPELLLRVYDSAMCHVSPNEWLDMCCRSVEVDGAVDAAQTPWGKSLMQSLKQRLTVYEGMMLRCAKMAEALPGEQKAAALLADNAYQIRARIDCENWDALVANKNIPFGTLRFSGKSDDVDIIEQIKGMRLACKDGISDAFLAFQDSSQQVLKDLSGSASAVRGMIQLVKRFAEDFAKEKKRRGILDFTDLEHRTLDLLVGKDRTAPTVLAREIGSRFREVMVDEYQDSNAVQDRIYMALTEEKKNCFMVGDVKQSIYQFRLADPGIFLQKYDEYADADSCVPGEGRKVVLSSNFRSGGEVLSAVNCVFETCMCPKVGGLQYGAQEALYEGIPHTSLGESAVELYAVDVQEETYPEEAAFVAQRIAQLLDGSHFVRSKDNTLRKIEPADIVILLRSPKSTANYYVQALAQRGIACNSGLGSDLMQTGEVTLLRAMLQVILNPQLDIPLASVLLSPLFCFTADELTCLRLDSRHGSLYETLLTSDEPKVHAFLRVLRGLREDMKLCTVSQLIERIFQRTKLHSIFAAMEQGKQCEENLNNFYLYAVSWEQTGQSDLGWFLEHLQALEERGAGLGATAQSTGCVTIMSIHKSKGLEFPVVFLCGLSRSINMESAQAQVLCHKELGIGLSAADSMRRVRYPTIAKRVIADRIEADSLSEELRVLYVAMTRARDRLIMTYASRYLKKRLERLLLLESAGCRDIAVENVGCIGDWVLLSALQRSEAGALAAIGGGCSGGKVYDDPWHIGVCVAPMTAVDSLQEVLGDETVLPLSQMEQLLKFRYPHAQACDVPSKLTATALKGRPSDEHIAQNTIQAIQPYHPSGVSGTQRGTAVHTLMQYLDLSQCDNRAQLQKQVEDLTNRGLITAQQAESVELSSVAAFLRSDLGARLRLHPNVIREFQFSVLEDASLVDPTLRGEQILMQGVVDCAMIDSDGITVIDFKTDRVTEQTLDAAVERYRQQVRVYARALEKIYGLPVKAAVLYFFAVDRAVSVI